MSYYLFESPWLLFASLAATLVAVLLFFRNNQRPAILALAVLLFLLLPLPFLLDYFVVTPAEQIDQVLSEMVEAAKVGDAEAIVARIAPQYNHGGETYDSLVALIRREIGRIQLRSIGINGKSIAADEREGTASFVAVVAGSSGSSGVDHYPIRLTLTFEQTSSGWKIVRIQRFEPVVNTDEEIPLGRR